MRYNILYAGDVDAMSKAVNEAIAKGWEPQGGLAPYTVPTTYQEGVRVYESWFAQAMVQHPRKTECYTGARGETHPAR